MRLEAMLQMRQEMRMKLAPQIIQSIEILQLPLLELQQRIDQELLENPVLEMQDARTSEDESAERAEPAVEEKAEPEGPPEEVDAGGTDENFEKVEDLSEYYKEYYGELPSGPARSPSSYGEKDPKLAALENSPAPDIPLEDHLRAQLAYLDIPEDLDEVCENIIANLDHRGYLGYPLEEIVASMESEVSEEQAEQALRAVQELEPKGVAARSLEECLALQLDFRDEDAPVLKRLIEEHLKDILDNRYPKVARQVGCSIQELKQAVEKIAKLNPMPGALFRETSAPHVVPELRVEKIEGEHRVLLEEGSLRPLQISDYYMRRLQDASLDERTREYLKRKLQSARWLIEAIEQRRSTLYNVSSEMTRAQQGFLEKGDYYLRPLKMQDIADRVGVHVSTVSRAISDKYIQTPRGVYSLKHFFTGGLRKENGEMESWETIRQKLTDIVNSEDKSNPLSDEDLAARLQQDGVDIARRTISKYRKLLSIPSSRQRKQY